MRFPGDSRVVMTGEGGYTREHCPRRFETNGARRRHDGQTPRIGGAVRQGGNGPAPSDLVTSPLWAATSSPRPLLLGYESGILLRARAGQTYHVWPLLLTKHMMITNILP